MVTGPGGEQLPRSGEPEPELSGEDADFARGLESIIDRALKRHPAGDRFVYGIHQELNPSVAEHIRRRYRAVGWSEVTIKPGATGAYLLILTP